MAQRSDKKDRPSEDAGTVEAQRRMMEEKLSFDSETIAGLSDEEIVEIERLYKLSAPIRIPTKKLDPNYEYRWINLDPKIYRRRRGVGWQPVTKDMLEKLSLVPVEELHMGTHYAEDGTMRIGNDLVFAYIPKRIIIAIRTARKRAQQEALQAGKRQFHEAGQLAGVETFDKYPS